MNQTHFAKISSKLCNIDYNEISFFVSSDIIEANPDLPWNYNRLSQNLYITWDIVEANPDKPWDYYYLSLNQNITWEHVKANPDKP